MIDFFYAGTVQLLERGHELKVLRGGLRQAALGQGIGIAVAGESGAGKSAVVASALEDVGRGIRVLRGHCDPLHTPRPLGPFRGLGLSGLSGVETQAGEGVARLPELCDRVYAELAVQPTVLVIEDLHWLDEISAELLRFLARRIEAVPLALVVTYRDLEIGPRHPVRPLLGDFATLEGLQTLTLRPLSVDAVRELAVGTTLDPTRLHAVTAGNPFFVTAVVHEPDLPMPGSVRDAVLARIAEIEPEDLEVLQLVATAPDGLDDRVLPWLGVGLPSLRRLDDTALLTRSAAGLTFRHELTRLAILSTVPPGGAGVLHTRLLDGLERLEPRDPAVLTHHAVGARDAERALRHARAAAAEAIAASSNTEAAAFIQIALTNLPATAPPAERAVLLAQLTRQLYLTSRLSEAIVAARASIGLWEAAGVPAGVAEAHSAIAVLEHQSGRRRYSDEHAATARAIADTSGVPGTIARVHVDSAMMAVICSDLDHAAEWADRALSIAADAGLEDLTIAARMMVEAGPCMEGDAAARERILEWTHVARRGGWDEQAWRGYIVVFAADFRQCNVRGAERLVDEALVYVTDRDLRVARHWHLSFRALVHLGMGRWSAAREDAELVLADAETTFGSIWPHYVLGLVALRCGEGDAIVALDDMWAKAVGIDDPQRLLSALCALAEAMWMTGRSDARVTDFAANRLSDLTLPDTRWSAGNLALWLRRLGIAVDVPERVADPYRLVLDGRYTEAAGWWRAAGDPFAEAMSYLDSPDPEHRVLAVALLDKAGAVGTADRLRVELRKDGMASVPQRPRESTRANPGGLTNRQFEVARLLAKGLSNNEIAERLYISLKTADHHVSAILAKLDVPNRRAVVTQAGELGLD